MTAWEPCEEFLTREAESRNRILPTNSSFSSSSISWFLSAIISLILAISVKRAKWIELSQWHYIIIYSRESVVSSFLSNWDIVLVILLSISAWSSSSTSIPNSCWTLRGNSNQWHDQFQIKVSLLSLRNYIGLYLLKYLRKLSIHGTLNVVLVFRKHFSFFWSFRYVIQLCKQTEKDVL